MWRMCILLLLSGPAVESLYAQSDVRWLIVNPVSLNFSSADPDTGVALASSTVTWRTRFGDTGRTWRLSVQAASVRVSNCDKIPPSAFRIACSAVSVAKHGNGVCASPVPLSTSPQVIASGSQGDHNYNSTAEIQVQFLDSWRYPAATAPACSLTLSYTLEAL